MDQLLLFQMQNKWKPFSFKFRNPKLFAFLCPIRKALSSKAGIRNYRVRALLILFWTSIFSQMAPVNLFTVMVNYRERFPLAGGLWWKVFDRLSLKAGRWAGYTNCRKAGSLIVSNLTLIAHFAIQGRSAIQPKRTGRAGSAVILYESIQA